MRPAATIAFTLFALTKGAEEIRFVGKSVMLSNYHIIRSLLDLRDHKSLVRAAGRWALEQPLLHAGAITAFAPTDPAFAARGPDWQEELVKHLRTDALRGSWLAIL